MINENYEEIYTEDGKEITELIQEFIDDNILNLNCNIESKTATYK